jgi:hypothetical protein
MQAVSEARFGGREKPDSIGQIVVEWWRTLSGKGQNPLASTTEKAHSAYWHSLTQGMSLQNGGKDA